MPSYDPYRSRGYDPATAETFARADEERPAPTSSPAGVPAPSEAWPSNPALWFEKPPMPLPVPPRGAVEGTGRFSDLDRMAQEEQDETALVEQQVAAYRDSLPPVKPNQVLDVGGVRVSAYWGERELELRSREAAVKKIRDGGRERR
ncbi:hypothetical protein [Segniliparus rugosus]|uniref:Uncharacterized protein n=1 Tax=Segniliparus rugosus (strain ATCC BAA-974 / DSM 45345 / CCUG 50838 / CIP 108380 / JCM 13579 / CDC 945) TaxID=679197 RepID=E5XNM9_SEGRC|nr:hypothetical protein [Segniliparus rugosus]EFV14019.1 hypothetical protein HMPREF9336_01100 [Segniliparus rugosus ATCC BAA-974]